MQSSWYLRYINELCSYIKDARGIWKFRYSSKRSSSSAFLVSVTSPKQCQNYW